MAVSGTLYTYPNNFRAQKALIAAQYSGAKVTVDDSFKFGETNKTDAFLSKFPLGKVPAFESANGECIFDSNAIAFAVANEQLRGKTSDDMIKVMQWVNSAENDLLPAATTWVFPCLGLMPFNKGTFESAKESVSNYMKMLNNYLLTRTYLVGERVSLADITVACTLFRLYENIFDAEFRGSFKNVNRWFLTIVNQPQVKAVIGDFKLCTKMLTFDNKRFAEVQQKMHGGSGGAKEGKKEKQPKKQEPKKEQKKEKSPEAEAPAAPAPKPKDPLDALPAGNFNMDDFKRFYSNNDEDKSVPYFWEKFDKENYSIWFGEYKYNDELAKIFMTCNLVGGMFQRLEKLRKNAFASVCVFGEDGNNAISGVWVWRGQELAFPLSDDWTIDYESYDWRKLDANTDETKKLVDQYFKWVGEDSAGRKFNQGKIFK